MITPRVVSLLAFIGAGICPMGQIIAQSCQPSCPQYCGSVCITQVKCSCPGESPVCEQNSGGSFWNCNNSCSPILLDPWNQGFHLTDVAGGVKFRVRPSGPLIQMSWPTTDAKNGWLVLDRNGNGIIDDFTELFGNMTPQPASADPNGYLALAVFDSPDNGGNGNGAIDPGDSVYSHLRVWIDSNHNGISEPGELHTLPELGIFRLDLRYWQSSYIDANGNYFRYRSRIVDLLGISHDDRSYDVFLSMRAEIFEQ